MATGGNSMDNKRDIKEQVTLKNNKSSELEINRPLTYYECVQLLQLCVENGLIERDREHDSNILVYRERGTESPEGWYSENLMSIAKELSNDFDGQKTLMEELKSQGINIEFHEPVFETLSGKGKIYEDEREI